MFLMIIDPASVAAIAFALFLGGVLKGAVGMGSPLIAVPVMASFVDVRVAVAVLVLPNLATNVWQLWTFRKGQMNGWFPWLFATAGAVGVALGTFVLVRFSPESLKLIIAGAVLIYVGVRLCQPNLSINQTKATRLALPLGTGAGLLQGAAGISAPISVSFLNAMRLPRQVFIPTISLFFTAVSLVQIPLLSAAGILNAEIAILGAAALAPLFLGMPFGALAAKSISAKGFDRLVQLVLIALALKLLFDVLA